VSLVRMCQPSTETLSVQELLSRSQTSAGALVRHQRRTRQTFVWWLAGAAAGERPVSITNRPPHVEDFGLVKPQVSRLRGRCSVQISFTGARALWDERSSPLARPGGHG